MTLTPGTRLGPYEVVAPLGAGGMGEVFRGRDTSLHRDVAIKVLPAALADDADRLARFEREAQALAALNHPNIAHIYGLEKSGATPAIIMEFVGGEDLSARIARGPVPLAETLPLARQIAEALSAAHEAGIIHRDLKPANIKVTDDGTVKLLDFGLAKALGADASAEAAALSTMTSPAQTQAGIILGTAAYMSPEQARGRPVDKRADIWAFGVVLYEMLTGAKAFPGETMTDVLGAIVHKEPDWTLLPTDVPARVRVLIGSCLEKEPRRRLRDIADGLLHIDSPSLAEGSNGRQTAARWQRAFKLFPWAALAAMGVLFTWLYPRPAAPPHAVTFEIEPPKGKSFNVGPGLLEVSPDGQRIAFVASEQGAERRLWVRALDSLEATPVANSDGAWHPAWSPDGRSIVFTSASGAAPLRRVELVGGSASTLAEVAGERPAWSQQGVILYNGPDGRLYRVAETGGTSSPVTELDKARGEYSHGWPEFLPDGRRFLFLAASSDRAKSAIYLASIDAPGRTHVLNTNSMIEYVPGHLVYQVEGTIMAQSFDQIGGQVTGDPMPILEGVQFNRAAGRGAFSVSPTGVLAYRKTTGASQAGSLTWFDATGKMLSVVGAPARYTETSLSPDGRRLVASVVNDRTKDTDLVMVDMERGVSSRFTSDTADDSAPVWSPDGQWVVFRSNRKGSYDLYIKATGGAKAERALLESRGAKSPSDFSPDGEFLLFVWGTQSTQRIWALAMTGDAKPFQVFPGTTDPEFGACFSPDGKWIAYSSGLPDSENVFVQPFPPNGTRERISTTTGLYPRWSADGRQLFYVTVDDRFMVVDVPTSGGALRAGRPRELFTQRSSAGFNMDREGRRFLLVTGPQAGAIVAQQPLTVVLNWTSTFGK